MSQQTEFDISVSRTLTIMVKKVKQLRIEACVRKEMSPVASRTDKRKLRAAVCERRISLSKHLQHLGTIRQQSDHRKPKFQSP